MAKLNWGKAGSRFFESGVDRVALYVDGESGVPWDGVTSIAENSSGGESLSYYLDGYKYLTLLSSEEFSGTITAYSAPQQFNKCDGTSAVGNGLFITQQRRKSFNLSYRTLVGNDSDGLDYGYKIHIVYGALASPTSRDNRSVNTSPDPNSLSWQFSTVAPSVVGIKPTAHFVIDTRFTPAGLVTYLEDILYGTAINDPRLPTAAELVDLFTQAPPIQLRNLATNPSFETTSGTVEVRRNLAPIPIAGATWLSAAGTGGVVTRTDNASGGLDDTPYSEITWTTAATGGNRGLNLGQAVAGTITPGVTYTASVDVRSSGASGYGIVIDWEDASGTYLNLSASTVAPAGWNRVSVTAVAPANASRFHLWVRQLSGTNTVGDKVAAGRPLVEASTVAGSYFSGVDRPRLRTNLARDPRATAWAVGSTVGWRNTRWFGSAPAAGSYSLVTGAADGPLPNITTYARKTWTSVPTSIGNSGDTGFDHTVSATSGIPVVPGDVWTFSSYLRPSVQRNLEMGVYLYDAAGVSIAPTRLRSTQVAAPGGQWTRLAWTLTIPAGVYYVTIVSDSNSSASDGAQNWVVGSTLDGTALLLERVGTLGPYLDGNIPADSGYSNVWTGTANASASYQYDADLTASWTGTANASASTLTGLTIVDNNLSGSAFKTIASSRWAKSGTRSGRLIPSSTLTDTYQSPGGNNGGMRLGMVAGKTYTALATLHLEAPLSGGLSSAALRIRAYYKTVSGGSSYFYLDSPVASNVAGSYDLRVTFSLPSDSTEAFVRLYGGSSAGNGDVWWDNFMVIEGTYRGIYFSGDTDDERFVFYDWDGTPNASQSIARSWNALI